MPSSLQLPPHASSQAAAADARTMRGLLLFSGLALVFLCTNTILLGLVYPDVAGAMLPVQFVLFLGGIGLLCLRIPLGPESRNRFDAPAASSWPVPTKR